ncbi:MMPL family transporter [Fructobacillus ficulneus]|uniref:MMPL family transporter n=1 Tax=Fructobacillus ficulneus TaxID=157463 RepID=UPI001FA87DED|nr:MMPL family transporter [Fructobacillus ficulneus]
MVVVGLAVHEGGSFAGSSLNLPNSQSQKALAVMNKDFPVTNQANGTIKVVFHSQNGKDLTDSSNQAKIQELLAKLSKENHVTGVLNPTILKSYSKDKMTAGQEQEAAMVQTMATAGDDCRLPVGMIDKFKIIFKFIFLLKVTAV